MDNGFSVNLNQPHKNQEKILKSKARYRVVACGRRFGKSESAKIAVVLRLTKGQKVWFCSPTNQNSKRMFREFVRLFKGFPENLVKINRTDMRIDLVFNDAFVEFKSLVEPDNLRGEGLDFVVIDEAAFVAEGVWDEVLRPMLLDTSGDALFISSTNGKNWFWRMYNMGLDSEYKDYESFHFTSYDNPLLKPEEIDEIRKTVPKIVFDREYLAVFEDDGGSVFRNISNCVRVYGSSEFSEEIELEELYVESILKEKDNKTFIFGIDWGQMNDYTVVTVYCVDDESLIEYSRINQILWKDIRSEVVRLYEKWNPIMILAEENNAKANIEELQDSGLPVYGFKTTAKSKPEIINLLSLVIENKQISLPNDKTLISELSTYAIEFTKAGNIKYSAPSGLHDDIVMSLAICYWGSRNVMLPESYKIITIGDN